MKNMTIRHRAAIGFACLLVLITIARGTPSALGLIVVNQQAASLVLGRPDFTNSPAGSDPTQTNMLIPGDVAVDPTTGKVFVADSVNNRVLRFASLAFLSNGTAAEAVLGQPNFTSRAVNITRAGMYTPNGVVIDSAGRLWVADSYNHRVLRFDSAATKANGADADVVLGQPDFVTGSSATTQSGMRTPSGVAVDSAGRLWVADLENHRVLRFDDAATKANGANADAVLGQADFTTRTILTTQSGMNSPRSVFIDSAARLWVADEQNNRVLRFDDAATKANGANADAVLGQPDFVTNTAATTQTGMYYPGSVTIDGEGRLYVADAANHRVLWFNSAAGIPNGSIASGVLGQPNFTSNALNNGGVSATSLYIPEGLFYDAAADVLWVADSWNARVLMYRSVYIYQVALPLVHAGG
jgi:sugar lactone lactonase YvrE